MLVDLDIIKNDIITTKQYIQPWYEPSKVHEQIGKILQDDSLTRVMITISPQFGKATDINTPILTVNGWVLMGDLRVGDYVYGKNGMPTKIIYTSEIFRNKQLYNVTSDDGSEVIADGDHLWYVRLCRKNKKFKTYKTAELYNKNLDRNPMLEKQEAVDLPKRYLPIPPYLLGIWAGDGCASHGTITKHQGDHSFLRSKIESLGFKTTDRKDIQQFGVLGLSRLLRENNLFKNKHIPEDYLLSSIEDRLQLLQGLIDSDGYVTSRGRVEFSSCNENLALSVQFLVKSLGAKCTLYRRNSTLYGVRKKDRYRVGFYLKDCASLPRKAKYTRDITKCASRYIKIKKLGKGDTRCIKVDAEDGQFLAGKGLLLTHNTEILCRTFPAFFLGHHPNKSVITVTYSQDYANKLSVKCRDFFNDPKFEQLFGLQLHPDQQAKQQWMINGHNGSAIFTGISGSVTGNTADILVLDDLVKNYQEATSKVKQEELWENYQTAIKTRLQSEKSRIIILMTRWLKHDLIGRIQAQEQAENKPMEKRFKLIHMGALYNKETKQIADKDILQRAIEQPDKYKNKLYSLWPERKSVDFLLDTYTDSPTTFMTMYQGNPKDLEGTVIDPKWFQYETDLKQYGEKEFSCRGWDFGYTQGGGDYTVGVKIDVYKRGEVYVPLLVDVVRWQEKPSITQEKVVETAISDGKDTVIGLEGGGTQIAMSDAIKERVELFDYEVETIVPKGDKVSRAMPWIIKVEDGQLKLVAGDWTKKYLEEAKDFGISCEHDDQIDATTTAWKALFG